jgi:hypothetical protein
MPITAATGRSALDFYYATGSGPSSKCALRPMRRGRQRLRIEVLPRCGRMGANLLLVHLEKTCTRSS